MLAKRLIPCLDVDRGRVVKGVRFVALRDAGDPVEAAARYDAEGADELVFLDITASSDARPIVLDMKRLQLISEESSPAADARAAADAQIDPRTLPAITKSEPNVVIVSIPSGD